MDDTRLESLLRHGPPDEPEYRGGIAARVQTDRDAGGAGAQVIELVAAPARTPATSRRWPRPAAAALVIVALGAGLLATLDGDESPRVTTPIVRDPRVLVDRWVGPPADDATMAAFVEFGDGGAFTFVTGSETQPTRWGSTWTVGTDGLLELTLNSEESGCRAGAVGTYRWSGPPNATDLHLDAVTDECDGRAAEITGAWTHTACPIGGSDCLGAVDAGTYSSVNFDPLGTNRYGQLAYTLPSGWAVTVESRAQFSLRPADDAAGVAIDVWADVAVAGAGCEGAPQLDTVSAGAVADAIAERGGLETTRSATVLDDRQAHVIDVAVAFGWSQGCPDKGDDPFVMLLASRSGVPTSWTVGLAAGERVRIILVNIDSDVDSGRTAAIVIRGDVDDSDAVAIVESFRLADASPTH